jgi:hypothetical protein
MRQLSPQASGYPTARFAMNLVSLVRGKTRESIQAVEWRRQKTRVRVCGAKSNQLHLPEYKLDCVVVEMESAQVERGCWRAIKRRWGNERAMWLAREDVSERHSQVCRIGGDYWQYLLYPTGISETTLQRLRSWSFEPKDWAGLHNALV